MKQLEIFKALSNKTRLEMLQWLKDPAASFPEQIHAGFEVGVCVGEIQRKSGLTQSTVSEYLSILQRAGLVSSTRVGLVLEERGVLRAHQVVRIANVGEGEITSGSFSPTLSK